MPKRNCTLMLAPGARGVARVTFVAESEELRRPPFGCEGGCSSVVPCTVTVEASVRVTTTAPEVRGRKSAVPLGAGKVSTSPTRNRRRETATPVLLVQVRLTE